MHKKVFDAILTVEDMTDDAGHVVDEITLRQQ
jgi:hypothetical protein